MPTIYYMDRFLTFLAVLMYGMACGNVTAIVLTYAHHSIYAMYMILFQESHGQCERPPRTSVPD